MSKTTVAPKQDVVSSLRFFVDPRVGFWSKLLVLLAALYVVFPIDLIPDPIVVIGWLDDIAAMVTALTALLFAFRRFKNQARAVLPGQSAPAPVPGVIETEGTEVR